MRDHVEEASFESFPASDPPTWIRMHAGMPRYVTIQDGRMVLSIIPDGERRYRIVNGCNREIGRVFGRAVRFLGFESESAVINAVRRAWRKLEPIRRRDGHRPIHPNELGPLQFVHDGAHEWISDGVIPLARIVRPAADAPGRVSYAAEWLVPGNGVSSISLEAIHAIATAVNLENSRIEE